MWSCRVKVSCVSAKVSVTVLRRPGALTDDAAASRTDDAASGSSTTDLEAALCPEGRTQEESLDNTPTTAPHTHTHTHTHPHHHTHTHTHTLHITHTHTHTHRSNIGESSDTAHLFS